MSIHYYYYDMSPSVLFVYLPSVIFAYVCIVLWCFFGLSCGSSYSCGVSSDCNYYLHFHQVTFSLVPISLPFTISGFWNFGESWLISSIFASTREVETPMRCVRCCLKLSVSFDIWWSYTYEEQIGCKSWSKMNFRSLAIEISWFWGAQIENWISNISKKNYALSESTITFAWKSMSEELAVPVGSYRIKISVILTVVKILFSLQTRGYRRRGGGFETHPHSNFSHQPLTQLWTTRVQLKFEI